VKVATFLYTCFGNKHFLYWLKAVLQRWVPESLSWKETKARRPTEEALLSMWEKAALYVEVKWFESIERSDQ
jgi:hypothetical protein